jgi:hypothetical protein
MSCTAARETQSVTSPTRRAGAGEPVAAHARARTRLGRPPKREKDAELAQKLGPLQPTIAVLPQECTGQFAYFGST